MQQFYLPELDEKTIELFLSEEESKHCIRVLRMKTGDEIQVLNGKGFVAKASILNDHPKKCLLSIIEGKYYPKMGNEIHIAMGPTKNMDRMEWFVEKATEIGLNRLTFLICDHNERNQLKLERLEKIAISAMKQSKRFYLPELNELVPFSTFVEQHPKGYIAHCNDSKKISLEKIKQSKVILIGPEGDFSPSEIAFAKSKGYEEISLSEFRLRTETAALISVMKLALI